MPGRPPILPDAELTRKVAGFVGAGHYTETACAFAGVSKHTYLKWLREGRRFQKVLSELPEGETISDPAREAYLGFLEAIERAQATAEVRDLTVIDKIAQGGLPLGSTTRTTRRVPMTDAAGNAMRDPNNLDQILYREDVTEVVSSAVTLPQWTAAAWRLERRNPDRWSRYTKHQVSGQSKDLLPLDSIRAVIDGDDDGDTPGFDSAD